MKARSILMGTPTVRAIQADIKTQTRRICNIQDALEFIAGDQDDVDIVGLGLRWGQSRDISESDAIAEGIQRYAGPLRWVRYLDAISGEAIHITAIDAYRALWEVLHGEGSWASNPWVWAVTFTRINRV